MKIQSLAPATRNTCFALISAIERDFRDLFLSLENCISKTEFLPNDINEIALNRWNRDKDNEGIQIENQFELVDYLDFADIGRLLNIHSNTLDSINTDRIKQVAKTLIQLTSCRNRVCHSRPLEADDFSLLLDFANDLRKGKQYVVNLKNIEAVLSQLETNPASLLGISIPDFWCKDESKITHNLPVPDFDETGFLGRKKNRRDVLKLLKSNHPVITVVGEGGVGKTALSLRCLYDLVELNDPSLFEVIIWSSSKTTMLSAGGVKSLKKSITNTLELYEHIADTLGVPDNENSIDVLLSEIKNYLGYFRTLLVIDNLETLESEHLRSFLLDIPLGSKILLTSRIGLGEIEIRYPIENLDSKTAVDLARRYSSSLNIDIIVKSKANILRKYCQRLFNNPLLIKWFISSVSIGANPVDLLSKQNTTFKEALQFCYTNLFERLKEDEKKIVHILSSAKRPLSISEIVFIASFDTKKNLELALHGLHNASMISRMSDSEDGTILYALTNTAQEYVSMFSPPPSVVFGEVNKAMRKLRILRDTELEKLGTYKYDIFAINTKNQDERIAAVNLKRALGEMKGGSVNEARLLIAKAKELLPNYSEIYRISGILESKAGNFYQASEEYEKALQIEPSSPIVNYNYALFLNKYLEDFDNALDKLNVALKQDKNAQALLSMKALVLNRLGEFSESISIYEKLFKNTNLIPMKWLKSMRDQAADTYRRLCERNLKLNEFEDCKKNIAQALELLEFCFKDNFYDNRIVNRYLKIIDEAFAVSIRIHDYSYASKIVGKLTNFRHRFPSRSIELYHTTKFREEFSDQTSLLISFNKILPL